MSFLRNIFLQKGSFFRKIEIYEIEKLTLYENMSFLRNIFLTNLYSFYYTSIWENTCMFQRLLHLPLESRTSIFLFGPRGTGKTSWLKAHIPDALYIDLLKFTDYSRLTANPTELENLIPFSYRGWIIIDEVQRVPELLNEVHRLIEEKKYRFILTGSSARSLKRKGVNLLAGRAFKYFMHPLTVQELGSDFNLSHALRYGLLPTAVTHENPQQYLENYVQTYLREEVLQEGLTRNIGSFTRFLEVASFSQGNVITMTDIARELGLTRFTVTNYFAILEDLLLSTRIAPFTHRAKRKMIAHEKFYYFDTGVYRTVRPLFSLDKQEEVDGAALETLFLQSAKAINDYLGLGYKIYFWRTAQGQEIDFILHGPGGLFAFEIKRTAHVSSKMLRSLKSFSEEYPDAKLYILHLGDHKEYYGPITAIPFEKALRELPELLHSQAPESKDSSITS